MPAQWTATIISQLHLNGITAKELAGELDWNSKYLSQVLNSRVNPKGAEEKVTAALNRIIQRRSQATEVAG